MSDHTGKTAWSYDPAGRVAKKSRTTNGITRTTSWAYNPDGTVSSITYPSGRVVNCTYNNARRATSATDANGTVYATSVTYQPHGRLASAVRGKTGSFAGITYTRTDNNRLQVSTLKASSAGGNAMNQSYGYGSANNGRITSITNNLDGTRSQSFTYDQLNRLASAQANGTTGVSCWGMNFAYDNYANFTGSTPMGGKCGGREQSRQRFGLRL